MKLVLKSKKSNSLMGLKVHQDGFNPTNSLQWWSVVASVRQRLHQLDNLIEKDKLRLPRTTFLN